MLAFTKIPLQRVTSHSSLPKCRVLPFSRSVAMQATQQQVSKLYVFEIELNDIFVDA